MKIRPNRQRGFAAAVWLILIAFVIFVVVIFGIAYTMIRTIERIVPKPPPDDKGWVPGIGDSYQGGVVTGYTTQPPRISSEYLQDSAPPGFTIHRVFIFSAPVPNPPAWTNCIWNGALADVDSVIGSNGLPMEAWPAGYQPSQRFYNIVISNSFSQ